MSFWWNEWLRSLNLLPLVFLPPPPCYDLHKLSFDIQGAVFWEPPTNYNLGFFHTDPNRWYAKVSKSIPRYSNDLFCPPSTIVLMHQRLSDANLEVSVRAYRHSQHLSRVFKEEYKVFKGIAICRCQLCGLSPLSDIRPHQLSRLLASSQATLSSAVIHHQRGRASLPSDHSPKS